MTRIVAHQIGVTYPQSSPLGPWSLTVQSGEWVALVGPSGCGKTTLLKVMGGLIQPQHGSVTLDGVPLTAQNRGQWWAQSMGFVLQTHGLVLGWSVLENVMVRLPVGLKGRAAREWANERLDTLGLSALRHRPAHALSVGESQRVALCRALMTRPTVLYCDEPTGSLDDGNAEAFIQALTQIHQAHPMTIVMVTHDTHRIQAPRTLWLPDHVV